MRKQLTPARLRNLKPPARGRIELYDLAVRGLTLRVFASGRASWSIRYRQSRAAAGGGSSLATIRASGLPKHEGERSGIVA